MTTAPELIADARNLLETLGFDNVRSNARSARTLLALLGLRPGDDWADATNARPRTIEIITYVNDHLEGQGNGKPYKPNTRETFRRFTLHQFIEAGMVDLNPDDPSRATNAPDNCYQVTDEALTLIQQWGQPSFDDALAAYLEKLPGLIARYAAVREMERIPVTAPDGAEITLSPGGQNPLIKQIVEDFGGYFLGGGQLLYLGDADSKWALFEQQKLADLGVTVDSHGKMPDVIVYMPDRNWLVLMEAATTHGPVDAKRHGELQTLFAGSTAGLVFVSCFPSRATMRKYLHEIAWETEVWCAEDPTHLIHFNGDKFLGPYE